ncbi:MAG: CHASE domain-containing protein, partial [Thermoguttaceae bacterium]
MSVTHSDPHRPPLPQYLRVPMPMESSTDKTDRTGVRSWIIRLSAFAVPVAAGALLACWSVHHTDRQMREDLLYQAHLVADAIDLESIGSLEGTEGDLKSPRFCRLKRHLQAVCPTDPNWKYLYLAGRRDDGTLFFYMDSEPDGSADQSPPGQIYGEASETFRRVFDSRAAATEGPIPDRWGTWMSAFVPLADPRSGKVAAVLGIDVDAGDWNRQRLLAGWVPLLLTATLVTMLEVGRAVRSRRVRSGAGAHRHHAEPVLVAAVGLVLTLGAAWAVCQAEGRSRHRSFLHLAAKETSSVAETLRDLCDIELEGLARFFEDSEQVTSLEFQEYTEYLTRNPAVHAWEWIPAVAEGEKARFEESLRREGIDGFTIWQKDGQGNSIPARGRDFYYPVTFLAPSSGSQCAPGFDLGSETVRRTAIEDAASSGLVTASKPTRLVLERGNQKGMLVCRPVFSGRPLG